MILSLNKQELYEYINRQAENYFPDRCSLWGGKRAFDLALDRTEYCFQHIRNYNSNGQVKFNHLHMDQYSTFLYYYSNNIWKMEEDTKFADKLILLNRALSGMWFSYKNNLPDIFCLVHPVGTVLGNANYDDYLVVLQNVTVNTVRGNPGEYWLNIGKGCYLSAGAKIIGNGNIGNWCTLGVNTVLHNHPLDSGTIAYNNSEGKLIIKQHDNQQLLEKYFIMT